MTINYERYIAAASLGALFGMVTGIVGPLYQWENNVDDPNTPDKDEGQIQFYGTNKFVHTWIVGWAVALVITLIGYGFGSMGPEWLIAVVAGAMAHVVVAYISGFVIPILANLAP